MYFFHQIVEEFIKKALELRLIIEIIITMIVNVKDEINLLSIVKGQTLSLSMMSTMYSPPRNY